MTDTKLIEETTKSFRKKFKVEINLSDCSENDLIQIISFLRTRKELNTYKSSWLLRLANIIENKN